MANFSLKSLTEGNTLIYATPLLVLMSLFHIFDPNPVKHQLGQIETIAALIICGYVLWTQYTTVFSAEKLMRKRIEFSVCAIVGLITALLLYAPLMTWQFVTVYLASDRQSLNKPILMSVLALWLASGVFFYGSLKYNMDRMSAAQSGLQQSSMPEAPIQ